MPLTPAIWKSAFSLGTANAKRTQIVQFKDGHIGVYDGTLTQYLPNGTAFSSKDLLTNTIGYDFTTAIGNVFTTAAGTENYASAYISRTPIGTSGNFTYNLVINVRDEAGTAQYGTAITLPSLGFSGSYLNVRVISTPSQTFVFYQQDLDYSLGEIAFRIYNHATHSFGPEILTGYGNVQDNLANVVMLSNGNFAMYLADAYGTDFNGGIGPLVARPLHYGAAITIFSPSGQTLTRLPQVDQQTPLATQNGAQQLEALRNGGFLVIEPLWNSATNVYDSTVLRKYTNAGTLVWQSNVDPFSGDESAIGVTELADGSIVAVVGQYLYRYGADGSYVGNAFRYTTLPVNKVTIEALADGRFTLTFGDDSTTDGDGTTDTQVMILDTRDLTNTLPVYGADAWQFGTVFADTFTAALTAKNVDGGAGADVITTSIGAKNYFGGDGGDRIIVTTNVGGDSYDGGAGVDTIDWTGVVEKGLTFDMTGGIVKSPTGNSEAMVNFENLTGTAYDDTIFGTAGANGLNGGAGNDYIDGGGGADTVNAGGDDDTIVWHVGLLSSNVTGGAGTDRLLVNDGSLPLGFNLVASGIERAQWAQHDVANAYYWFSIVSNFDTAWKMTDQVFTWDSGTTKTTQIFYDTTNTYTWKDYSQNFDQSNRLTDQTFHWDAGATKTTQVYYDPTSIYNWKDYSQNFNASDQLTDQTFHWDSGAIDTTTIYYDPTSSYSWTDHSANYTNGVLMNETFHWDAGNPVAMSYLLHETSAAHTWTVATYNYDAANHLINVVYA